jgi:Peptidase family M28
VWHEHFRNVAGSDAVSVAGAAALTAELSQTIESLAGISRLPTSPGERRAADLIRDRFAQAGCRVVVEEVPAYDSYARPIGLLCAIATVAGLLAGQPRGERRDRSLGRTALGVLGGAGAAYGIMDDITGGRLLARRALMRRRTTSNVIAEAGDPGADRTLVVLVHHDAAPSGVVFGQYAERWLASRHPEIIESMTSNPPLWWAVLAGPLLVAAGSALRSSWLRKLGVAGAAISTAALTDIALRPAVSGANDNLSGVAAALAVAAALRDAPAAGLRVLFVSAGAEEALQQGIREFARGHFGGFDPDRTWFLTLDTVGSGNLLLLEGEGTVRMHDYDAAFKDLVADCAREAGIPLTRGLRSRNSTDGCVPRQHGFRVVTLVSVDDQKLLPNYHQYSDIPENVDYRSVRAAAGLVVAVARRLAAFAT